VELALPGLVHLLPDGAEVVSIAARLRTASPKAPAFLVKTAGFELAGTECGIPPKLLSDKEPGDVRDA
jgi:hypothetical protein